MDTPHDFPQASMLGGPFHRLGRRLGLVRGASNTVLIGLALGWSLWLVTLALALVSGVAERMFVLPLIGAHARLLVVIPLLFVAETWLDPQVGAFVRSLVEAGVVRARDQPLLATHLRRLARWRDSWVPDVLCLAGAILMGAGGGRMLRFATTAVYDPALAVIWDTPSTSWYYLVGMTIFRFLVFRWLWRLGLWWLLLRRISRMNLNLVPTHPDAAGGLGDLEVVQAALLPLVLALSVIGSASYAESMSRGSMPFDSVYPALATLVIVDLTVIVGPLLNFAPKLWAARKRGYVEYMELASRYVNAFHEKWVSNTPPAEPLLGTPDLQSLADLSTGVGLVRDMRLIPASPRLLMWLAAAAMLPLLPLWLFQYPLAELIQTFLARLFGL